MIKRVFRQMLSAQIISSMTVMLCMLVDSIMIGRFLGVDSMTAYGLATPVLLVFAAVGTTLSAGIQVMCGKTMGGGDMKGTNACFSVSVFLAFAISAVGSVLVIVFATPICTLLGAGEPVPGNDVFFLTRDYLRGFIIGAPAFIFAQIMVPYMQITGNRARLVTAVAAMTVADVALDILNVFVVKQGTFGMGVASSVSYYIAFFIGLMYFLKKKCAFRFSFAQVKAKTCGTLLKYGVPTVVNQISLVLMVFVMNSILLGVGKNNAVAAYSVISTVGNICYCVGSGVASVALMLSSIFYSDEDRSELCSLVKTMTFYSALLVSALTVIVFFASPALVALFLTEAPEAADMAVLGVRLFSLSLLPSALNTTFKNYYQGVNRAWLTQAISLMQNFALVAAFAFLLSRFWGVTGVWLSFLCGETLTLVITAAIVFAKNRRVSFSAETFAFLPDGFGAAQGDCFETSADSIERVVEASEQAQEFCIRHGETQRNSSLIALCIEEMAVNIVRHGFADGGKEHSIDIRLVYKDGRRVIRIRDNCADFDPVKYMELHRVDEPTAHIGIRMVMKMVKSANYVNSLGLNNLTLVL